MTATQLPDGSVESSFLKLFGKPQRAEACECERDKWRGRDDVVAGAWERTGAELDKVQQRVNARKLAPGDVPAPAAVRGMTALADANRETRAMQRNKQT